MRQTDDYWFKWAKANNKAQPEDLKDPKDGKHVSLGLSKMWVSWINKFIDERIAKMEGLLESLWVEIENDWNIARDYSDLDLMNKTRLQRRMNALEPNIDKKVRRDGLKITTASGRTSPVSDLGSDSPSDLGDDDPSDPDAPDDTPSKPPKTVPGPSRTIPIRLRPSPLP